MKHSSASSRFNTSNAASPNILHNFGDGSFKISSFALKGFQIDA